jgi:hypothetical protein
MNKIIVLFQPVITAATPSGKLAQRALKPRDTYELAATALRDALLKEKPGSNGQVEEVFVCVDDGTGIVTPPDAGKLILPN